MDPLLDFAINLFLFVLFFATFVSQSFLLYKSTFMIGNRKLSAQILNNMFYWCLVAFLGFMQSGYKCLYPVDKRSIFFLYMIGIPFGGLTAPISLSVSFLLLDRIFVFVYPVAYQKYRKIFASLTVTSCILMAIFINYTLFLNLSQSSSKCVGNWCKFSGYFMFLMIRVAIGIINLILGVMMFIVLNRYTTTHNHNSQFKKANRITVVATIIEVTCNFIPNFCIFIGSLLQIQMSELAYTYPVITIGLDAFATAFIYRFVINSKRKFAKILPNNTRVVVFPRISPGIIEKNRRAKESISTRF